MKANLFIIAIAIILVQITIVTGDNEMQNIKDTAFNIFVNHDYVKYKYDCTQFSRDLKNSLVSQGIKARCVFGIYDDDLTDYKRQLHTWVEVNHSKSGILYVEATNGEVIPDELMNKNYKIITRGVCA